MGNCCGLGKCTGLSCEPADKGTPIPRIKTSGRSCTDFPFLLVFLASWAAIWVIFSGALRKKANPNALVRGVDWNDQICGVDNANRFAAWPGLPYDPQLVGVDPRLLFNIKICVSACSETNKTGVVLNPYPSKKFLYYCIPTKLPDGFDDAFNSDSQQAQRAFGDLRTSWQLILISGAIAIALSFLFALFSKKFAGVLVWLTLIGLLLGGALMSYTLLQKSKLVSANAVTPNDTQRAKWLRVMGIIATVSTFLFFCIIVALRKRINIAIQVVKESSKVITSVPSLVFFPILPLIVALGYFVFWVYVAIYVFSVQVLKPDQDIPTALQPYTGAKLKDREFDKSMQRSLIYHFFHLLWNIQFLIYFAYLVVAGVVADWYFTPFNVNGTKTYGKGEGQLRSGLVRRAIGRTICHHIGTIALGSLIIAIIQFARAIVTYLQKQSKNQNNRIQKAIFCMIQCCLKCVECCMDKISKNAFIWVAVYGDAFCASAAGSFELVWRNLLRVAAINLVGNFIIILGKILVSFLTAGIAAIILIQTSYADDISSPILPIFVVFCLAFLVSSLFMIIFETTIDSVFLCFLIDEENNKNGVMLASKDLQNIINKYSDDSKKIAAEMQANRSSSGQALESASPRPNGAGRT